MAGHILHLGCGRLWLLVAAILVVSSFSQTAARAESAAERQRVAAQLVDKALDYEAHGQASESQALLDSALTQAPDMALARWHRGFVKLDNHWTKVADAPQVLAAHKALAAYRSQREKYPLNIAGQLELADWCAKKKLVDHERAHLTKVVELNPDHEDARHRLGFERVDGNWRARSERAQAEARERQSAAAMRKWLPRVEHILHGLSRKDQRQRDAALEQLQAISDPAAIVALDARLAFSSLDAGNAYVEMLDRIPDHEAALALARQGVFSPWAEVREAAAGKLRTRALEIFVPALLSALYSPVESEMALVASPDGRLFYNHSFKREGQEQKDQADVSLDVERVVLPGADGSVSLATAMLGIEDLATSREQAVADANRLTNQLNERICWLLSFVGDHQITSPRRAWQWWAKRNEVYMPGDKPTARSYHTDSVTMVEVPVFDDPLDCLAAGTPVWTDQGPLAIDKVKVGDRVLSQDPDTGELAYKPVLRTTVRPTSTLIRIAAEGEVFESSGGHPFWQAGSGWVKARRLSLGGALHGVSGPRRIDALQPGSTAETYNLIVADFHTYFVGQSQVLSHDNTVRLPSLAGLPGQRKK